MSLASRINEIRKSKNLSIDELCERSGIPKGTLSKITAGITTSPTLDTVRAIASALDCTLDDLDDSPSTIKKSPPEPGEESSREEQLRLERNWAPPQENQLPKGTAFYNAMMAQSTMVASDILQTEARCLVLLDQAFRKARFGDQYDKDTLSCAADFLSICSRGLDQSQKKSSSLFSYARRLLLQTVKLIDTMAERNQKDPDSARGALNGIGLLVSWTLYAFSVGKYEEFDDAWSMCMEAFDKYGIGSEAIRREHEARAEAELYYQQRLSKKKQESPASSANESGVG